MQTNNIIIGRIDGYEVYSTGATAIPGACEGCQDPETPSDQRQGHFACRQIHPETRELLDRGVLSMAYGDNQWETSMVDRQGFEAWRRERSAKAA